MNDLPNRMEIELTEQDVETNLVKILQSMSNTRSEAVLNGVILSEDSDKINKQKDEYLHLSHRLKNCLETLASDVLVEKMQNVVDHMNKDERLLRYDPLQDGYWEKNNPEFDDGLEEILIRFMKDDFNSLDSKHHILQAIKLLGIAESSDEERVKVFNTILPYHGPVAFEKQGLLKRILGVLFGSKYKIEKIDDLTVEFKGDPDFFESVFNKAKDMGYTNLKIGMNEDILDKLKEKYVAESVGFRTYIPPEWPLKIANVLQRSKIGYPILGSLPSRWQKYFNDENSNYSIAGAFVCSIAGEFSLIMSLFIASVAHFKNPLPGLVVIAPLGVDMIWKLFKSSNYGRNDMIDKPVASAFAKIPLYPFEWYYRNKMKKANDRSMVVNARLNDFVEPVFCNVFEYFNELASAELSESAEKNLEWCASNHYSFAKIAKTELEQLMREDISLNKLINQTDRFLTYEKKQDINKYVKTTSLFLGKDERYIISYITRGDPTNNVASVLREDISNEEKLKKIAENTKSHFAHLVKYEKNEKIIDLEATP
jgi:hypothetical protein